MKINEITEAKQRTDEALPLIGLAIAGARVAAPWAIRQGARILAGAGRGAAATPRAVAQVGRGVGAAGTGVGIGATGLAINDIVQMAEEGIDAIAPLITSVLGNAALQKIVAFSTKYGLPILAAVALLYGGKKVIDYLKNQNNNTDHEEKTNEVTTALSEETIGSFAENIVKTLNKATGLTYDHPRWGEIQADVFELVKQSGTGSRNQKSRGVLIKWGAADAAHQTGKDRREIRQIARKLI